MSLRNDLFYFFQLLPLLRTSIFSCNPSNHVLFDVIFCCCFRSHLFFCHLFASDNSFFRHSTHMCQPSNCPSVILCTMYSIVSCLLITSIQVLPLLIRLVVPLPHKFQIHWNKASLHFLHQCLDFATTCNRCSDYFPSISVYTFIGISFTLNSL